MAYQGDIPVNQTIYWLFITQFSGLPTTLSGSPVLSVYKDDNTTETITGPTLVADFDGRAGLNSVKIATTDAFYATGHDYTVVITTGTVGGVSAIGYVVGTFSIDNRNNTDLVAIKTQTDKFVFGVTNQVDANVKSWLQQTVAAAVNGIPKVDLFYVLGTILTEGAAGRLVGGIVKFFNIATPAATMDHGILVDTVTTLTNAPADSTTLTEVGADVDEIITTLGIAGAGLTAIPDSTAVTEIGADVDTIQAITDQFRFTIANQVDANALSGGGSGLDAAGVRAAVGMASANMDTQLAEIGADADELITTIGVAGAGLTQAGSSGGVGSKTCVINVSVGANPIDGADVWATTDLAGANIVASGLTDAFGNITFHLDPGTYYFWKEHSGDNFTNPESGVVS